MTLEKYNRDIESCSDRTILQLSKRNFLCVFCGKGFLTEKYFKIHLKIKHKII